MLGCSTACSTKRFSNAQARRNDSLILSCIFVIFHSSALCCSIVFTKFKKHKSRSRAFIRNLHRCQRHHHILSTRFLLTPHPNPITFSFCSYWPLPVFSCWGLAQYRTTAPWEVFLTLKTFPPSSSVFALALW